MPKYNTYDGKIKLNVGDVVVIKSDHYTNYRNKHYIENDQRALMSSCPIGEKCVIELARRGSNLVLVFAIDGTKMLLNTRDLSFVGTSAELNRRRWGKRTIQTFHRDRDEAQAK